MNSIKLRLSPEFIETMIEDVKIWLLDGEDNRYTIVLKNLTIELNKKITMVETSLDDFEKVQ